LSIEKFPDISRPELYLLTYFPDVVLNDDLTDAQWAVTQGYHLSVKYSEVTEETVSVMHSAGKMIGIWTLDAFNKACHYIFDLGVDCVTSNKLLF